MTTSERIDEERVRPLIQVSSKLLDPERVSRLNTADVLNLARIARRKDVSEKGLGRIRDLCPDLIPSEKKLASLPTSLMSAIIDELIRIKKFPPETTLEVDYILGVGPFASFAGDY